MPWGKPAGRQHVGSHGWNRFGAIMYIGCILLGCELHAIWALVPLSLRAVDGLKSGQEWAQLP